MGDDRLFLGKSYHFFGSSTATTTLFGFARSAILDLVVIFVLVSNFFVVVVSSFVVDLIEGVVSGLGSLKQK